MKLVKSSSRLSTQWQDVDATSTLYDVAVAFGIDKIPTSADVSATAKHYALSAIQSLDVNTVSVGAGKTLASIGQVDGKIQAKTVSIQINQAQVNGLPSKLTSIVSELSSKQDILVATSQQWKSQRSFKPRNGQIVIWSDKSIVVSSWEEDGHLASAEVAVPGIKIGNGNAYNLDLPFVEDDIAVQLSSHIQSRMHITAEERADWSHKITVGDINDPEDDGVIDETLIITRN